MKSNLVAMAVAIGLGALSYGANASTAATPASRELAELESALANLRARIDELEQRTDAQTDVNIGSAQAVEKLQDDGKKVDRLSKLVNNTTLSGRLYIDLSTLSQETNGVETGNSGFGFDVKRAYVGVTHKFDDTWSANVTTDFTYVAADGQTQVLIKKAYLQGNFSDAFEFRVGSTDMPWIPFVEKQYGYRYVENTLVDKQKHGNSADWGLNANGKLAGGAVDYSASVVSGGGYKNPSRSSGMDVEARIGFSPLANTVIAIGGYSGKLGKDTASVDAFHTATRADAMIAYANGNNRIGAEYFQSSNWSTVLKPLGDKADGYSLWGSYGISDALSIFGRYDSVNPSKELEPSLQGTYYNAGLQWAVAKGIKVAAVYKSNELKSAVTEQKTRELGVFGEVSF